LESIRVENSPIMSFVGQHFCLLGSNPPPGLVKGVVWYSINELYLTIERRLVGLSQLTFGVGIAIRMMRQAISSQTGR
jgi:hypothetical protein